MGLTEPLSGHGALRLNESPSEKEGKSRAPAVLLLQNPSLNESPSEKEGKSSAKSRRVDKLRTASMKVPPKRKGNVSTISSGCVAQKPQ